jgi:NAD(P)H-hydrate epimerase
MERLSDIKVDVIKKDLIATARNQADSTHIYVLKDARTIVSDGSSPTYINESGNHGMAVGGSGDVLTGIICGFLAGGLPLTEAARLGVYCHGLAGDEAAVQKGYYGLKASDIAEYLGKVIN